MSWVTAIDALDIVGGLFLVFAAWLFYDTYYRRSK